MRSAERPAFRLQDALELALWPILIPSARLLPARWWGALSLPLGLAVLAARPRRTRATARRVAAALGTRHRRARYDVELRHRAGRVEERLMVFRAMEPRGRPPSVTLVGADHVRAALAAGHGAVLWACAARGSTLASKIGLHEAGFRLTHLSRLTHGFGTSRFAVRCLNPLWARVESRFLEERLIIEDDHSLAWARKLERKLRANQLVSITCRPAPGRHVSAPFLGGRVLLPTGPVTLALATGAALLPVFTLARGSGAYEVVVEPPLLPTASTGSRPAIDDVARRYAARMESHAQREPAAWMWHLWEGG